MPRGGPRLGSGRPPGSPNLRTRAVAARAAAEGISPVEAMLSIMRDALVKKDSVLALEAARHAAPYCHPRLSAVLVRGDRESDAVPLDNPALVAFVRDRLVEAVATIEADPEMQETLAMLTLADRHCATADGPSHAGCSIGQGTVTMTADAHLGGVHDDEGQPVGGGNA